MVSDVIDLFGQDIRFKDETDNEVTVAVHANEMAIEQFAKSYAPDVTVIEPKALADKIKLSLQQAMKNYDKKEHL